MGEKTWLLSCFLLALQFTVPTKAHSSDKILILEAEKDFDGPKKLLLIMKPNQNCQVYSDPALIEKVMKSVPELIISVPSMIALGELFVACKFDVSSNTLERFSSMERKMTIFPGTKWCGDGQEAETYEELGSAIETDKCCRDHDFCDDLIFSGETKHNITNESSFTILNCKCDDQFYDCLMKSDKFVSNEIGNIYFNYLRRECYKYDYPLSDKCEVKDTVFLIPFCKKYAKNTKVPQTYQLRPARWYNKVPISVRVANPIFSLIYGHVLDQIE